ncbi:hypothetical protein SLEP1_g16356 [Rubroshorea leprosula]|uniref:Uncharacterized protein n=1 Tax=Rubroshorea leprosula TaxID=152421 RepID=A0AAV5IZV3_9ROSI|nr:hypothetical protein SLEP1_g16356 [Rubroshorea leprosula]
MRLRSKRVGRLVGSSIGMVLEVDEHHGKSLQVRVNLLVGYIEADCDIGFHLKEANYKVTKFYGPWLRAEVDGWGLEDLENLELLEEINKISFSKPRSREGHCKGDGLVKQMVENVDHALEFQLVEILMQQVIASSKGGKSTALGHGTWKRIDRNLASTHHLKKEIKRKRKKYATRNGG